MKLLFCFCLLQLATKVVSQTPDTVADVIPYGYTDIRQESIATAVGYVSKEDFNSGYISSAEQLFQGKVAGVSISRAGGNPNKDFYTRIRGLNTLNSYSQPLIVVDGIPGGFIDNLDPNDIESISILKDAAGSSLYGIRGANGIILITTKSGSVKPASIELNSYFTLEKAAKNVPVLDAASWRKLSDDTGYGTDLGASTDWYDEIEQTAISQVYNLSVEGGTNQTSWRSSLNYRNVNGILRHSGYSKLNGRMRLSQRALKDRAKIDIGFAGTENDINYSFDEAFHYAPIYNPTAPVYNDALDYEKYGGYFQELKFDYYNPVSIIDQNISIGKQRYFEITAGTSLNLAKWLTWNTHFASQTDRLTTSKYLSKYELYIGADQNGVASIEQNDSRAKLFETTLHFSGSPVRSIKADLYAGYSFQGFTDENFSVSVSDFLTDHFTFNNLASAESINNGDAEVQTGKSTHRLAGFFGWVNLSWKNWLVNASYRYEGSSRLGKNKKWSSFPSVGLAYKWHNNIKLRVSYGIAGNIPSTSYTSLVHLKKNGLVFPYSSNWIPIYMFDNLPNPDLQAERKSEWNLGIDFALFNSKLRGTYDYYKAKATNLLMEYSFFDRRYYGKYYSIWYNGGEIKNSGNELTLNYQLINRRDLSYTIHFNAAWGLKNELVSMTGSYRGLALGNASEQLGYLGSPGACCAFLINAEEGKPVGQLVGYIYDGIDPTGVIKYKDIDESGWIDHMDVRVSGNGLPKSMIGLGQSVSYKHWNFDVFFRGVFGHSLLNSFRAHYESVDMMQTYNLPENILSMRNSETNAYLRLFSGRPLDINIEKASFLSLDYLTISYLFESVRNDNYNLAVYFAGNNLFYLTKYKGADPNPRYLDEENSAYYYNVLLPGIDRRATWSRTRSFTVGFKLTLK